MPILSKEYIRVYQGPEIKKIRRKIEEIPDGHLMKTVILIALEQIGYTGYQVEAKGMTNATRYAEILDELGAYYGEKQGFNWCDLFVDYLYTIASGSKERANELLYQVGGYGAGTTYSYQYYALSGAMHRKEEENTPQIGDQIFLRTRSTPNAHTGIVVAVDRDYVYTIEGNTVANPNLASIEQNISSEELEASGSGVYLKRYRRDSEKIVGYGRPKLTENEKLERKNEQQINEYIIQIYNILNRNLTPLFPGFSDISSLPDPTNVVRETVEYLTEFLIDKLVRARRVKEEVRKVQQEIAEMMINSNSENENDENMIGVI